MVEKLLHNICFCKPTTCFIKLQSFFGRQKLPKIKCRHYKAELLHMGYTYVLLVSVHSFFSFYCFAYRNKHQMAISEILPLIMVSYLIICLALVNFNDQDQKFIFKHNYFKTWILWKWVKLINPPLPVIYVMTVVL